MAVTDFETIFKKLSGIRVGVIGDMMLDTYWWGHVERISPERTRTRECEAGQTRVPYWRCGECWHSILCRWGHR